MRRVLHFCFFFITVLFCPLFGNRRIVRHRVVENNVKREGHRFIYLFIFFRSLRESFLTAAEPLLIMDVISRYFVEFAKKINFQKSFIKKYTDFRDSRFYIRYFNRFYIRRRKKRNIVLRYFLINAELFDKLRDDLN